MGMATSHIRTTDDIDCDWQWEKQKKEIEKLLNRLRSILEIKIIEARHQKESKIRLLSIWFRKPLYHLRLSRAEYSGKNFCKGKNGK